MATRGVVVTVQGYALDGIIVALNVHSCHPVVIKANRHVSSLPG